MPQPAKTWALGTQRQPKPAPYVACQYRSCQLPAAFELVMPDVRRLLVCREHEEINLVEYLREEAYSGRH